MKCVKGGVSLVQFMSNMSSRRHDFLVLHIRHTDILQPHQERRKVCVFFSENSTFSEHGHVAYQIKENHEMQQHGNKNLAHTPHDPWDGVTWPKSTFLRTWSYCISN